LLFSIFAYYNNFFENRVLRRIFRSKRNVVTGGWRKIRNEELYNLYFSPSIIRMIKSRMMKWAGHVALLVERGMHIGYWWESQMKRAHWEDKSIGGWTILKWISEK
jgi:hypothetical protein